jgi:membrane associated rhomboid family serine protease
MIPLRDLNPTRRLPVLTITLIGVNVLVFLFQQSLTGSGQDDFIFEFGMRPAFVLGDLNSYAYTLVTHMFLHGDWLHIGSNMLYLWIFGNNIEDRLGTLRFLLFYFITGFLAAGAQIAVDPGSTTPNIGASGAIAGVLGAYLVLFPNARVQTLVLFWFFPQVIEVAAGALLGWWIFLQVIAGVAELGQFQAQGGIAYFAHIGGFAAGWLLIRLFAAGRPSRPDQDDIRIRTVDDMFQGRRRRSDRWWE